MPSFFSNYKKTLPRTGNVISKENLEQYEMQQALEILSKKLDFKELAMLATIWWCIWYTQNNKTFNPNDNINNLSIDQLCLHHIINWEKTKQWKEVELERILPNHIVKTILNIYIPQTNMQDRLYWSASENGWFSTSSVVELVQKTNHARPTNNSWIWKINVSPKIKHFLWKMTKLGKSKTMGRKRGKGKGYTQ